MMRSSLNFSNEEMEDDKFVKKEKEKKSAIDTVQK